MSWMTPGAIVGKKYRLTRQIGEGAMGTVWAAVNEDTTREVALKFILRSNEELRIRLKREARAAGKLRHPNIIEIIDQDETAEGDPFLVMPLLTGETLSELLSQQRRLDPAVAARIARDVARALAAAHARQVIHRDLKPANIFLHQEQHADAPIVKVLDFGVSKNLETSDGLATIAGGAVGSPAYMSPEQARTDPLVDHRTDIWSLGIVLFEMLTGVRPFKGDAHTIIPQIVMGEIPLVSRFVRHIDPGIVAIVSRCLERDRDKRIGSGGELAVELERFANPPSVVAVAPPSNPTLGRSPSGLADLESTALITNAPPPKSSSPISAAAAPRAPYNSRPEIVDFSTNSPSIDALSVVPELGPSFQDDDDEDSFAQTTKMSADKMAAMLGRKMPAPSVPRFDSATPAPQGYGATAPLGVGSPPPPPPPASPFGAMPLPNAPPRETERLASGPNWQPVPPHSNAVPGAKPASESGNWGVGQSGTILIPHPSQPSLPPARYPSSPGSSTAPLLKQPPPDSASHTMVAMLSAAKSRRRVAVIVVGAMAGIAVVLLGFGLYQSLKGSLSVEPELASPSVAPDVTTPPPRPSADVTASSVEPVPSAGDTASKPGVKPSPTASVRPATSPLSTQRPLGGTPPRPMIFPSPPGGAKPNDKSGPSFLDKIKKRSETGGR